MSKFSRNTDPNTSHKAGEQAADNQTLREMMVASIFSDGDKRTDEQLTEEFLTRWPAWSDTSARQGRKGLERKGKITDVGMEKTKFGRSAKVWQMPTELAAIAKRIKIEPGIKPKAAKKVTEVKHKAVPQAQFEFSYRAFAKSMPLRDGEIVAIVGPTHTGKSELGRYWAGMNSAHFYDEVDGFDGPSAVELLAKAKSGGKVIFVAINPFHPLTNIATRIVRTRHNDWPVTEIK